MPRYFIILCLVFIFLSFAPSVYEISQKPHLQSNRSFELVHNYYTDYNFYLSRIRQGLEGRVTVQEKYTSEKHQRSLIQIFYLSLGWAGRLLRIPPSQAQYPYHMARIVLGFTLLWVLSHCIVSIWKERLWRVIAFFVVVTASSWPDWPSSVARGHFIGYMQWWTVVDPLLRITFIPHLLASQLIIVSITYVLCKTDRVLKANQWMFFSILGLALGFIFPPGLLFLYGILFFTLIFRWILHVQEKGTQRQFFHLMLGVCSVILVSIPALLYFFLLLSVSPWRRLVDFYVLHPTVFSFQDYLRAVGPVLPFGIIGAVVAIIRKEQKMFVLSGWIFTWGVLLYAFAFFKQTSPLRITELAPHIPLGIFTVYGCYVVYVTVQKKKSIQSRIIQSTILIFLASIITIGILMTYGSLRAQKAFITQKVEATYPLVHGNNIIMYPLKDFIDAMVYLEANIDHRSIVLSELTAGNYMPVYSGNTVFIGQENTVNAEEKKLQAEKFFSGTMNRDDAREWLVAQGIQYVYYGPQERDDGGPDDLRTVYPFLRELYRNMLVIIYQVQ